MKKYLFIGEERSELAKTKGYVWLDGRLAAKQLFDALKYCNINPQHQLYINLFESEASQGVNIPIKEYINKCKKSKIEIVGMGNRVSDWLRIHEIVHIKIIHPAARGKIRKKMNYFTHIKDRLC